MLIEGENFPVTLDAIPGGYAIGCKGQRYALVSDWQFREVIFRGTCNGEPIRLQIERAGLEYRIMHYGRRVKAVVMTAKADRLLALMPAKLPPDLSKYLLSPMPGLLWSGRPARAGGAGRRELAVIEAMKMENILKAEKDCTVKENCRPAGGEPVGRSGDRRV